MRLPLVAVALVLASPASAVENPACPFVAEALENTVDVLFMVRDGKVSGNAVGYLADAYQRAAEEMRSGEWTEGSIAAADASFALASDRGETFAEADAESLVALAGTVAAETAMSCDADRVPLFPRPGAADRRACAQVVEMLFLLGRVLPTVAGEPGALPTPMVLVAAREAEKSAGQAVLSQWSAAGTEALTDLAGAMRALAAAPERTGSDVATEIVRLAIPVATETSAVCGPEALAGTTWQ